MDYAVMGWKVETSEIDVAVQKLNKIKPAAAGASAAAEKLAKAAEGASLATHRAAVAAARAEASKTQAVVNSMRATQGANKADLSAAIAANKKAQAALSVAKAERDRAAAAIAANKAEKSLESTTNAATNALKRQDAALNSVAATLARRGSGGGGMLPPGGGNGGGGGRRPGQPANDLIPNRFNTANIAAQFQDIGVTAAMGMSPLTIALQQGTQLSAILNSMENPLKGIAVAFRSILNPVSLLSIAFVALVAVGIQLTDWTEVARGALNFLADAIEVCTPYVIGLSAALALVYSPAIIAGFATTIMWMGRLGVAALATGAKIAAAWVIANPVTAFALGLSLVLVAMYQFRDEMAKILGFDIFEIVKKAANAMIGILVSIPKLMVLAFQTLPTALGKIIYDTANIVIAGVEMMVNGSIDLMNKLPAVELDKVAFERLTNPFEQAYTQSVIDRNKILAENMGYDYVGAVGTGIAKGSKGIADKLRAMASGLGQGAEDGKKGSKTKTEADKYEDIVRGAERRIASLKAEKAALNLTALETAKLKYETDLLNEAQQKNINLTPLQRAELGKLAGTMAQIEIETQKAKEAMDFLKDTAKSFFSDLRDGVKEGKSLFESFSNAVMNAVDRMMDKFLDSAFNGIFENMFSSGAVKGAGGGGILDSIISLFSAKGNVFANDNVTPFAKGAGFTNGIYNSPKMFAYANGGKFGVMGEAGPEAVMPLHRGSDGSLGVRVEGAMSPNVQVFVYNNTNSQVTVKENSSSGGKSIEVMIDEAVARNINKPGSSSNQAIRTFGTAPMQKG